MPVLDVLDAGLLVRALAHVTGDGLFNLVRTVRPVGFDIERWPPPPIFAFVQRLGQIADEVRARLARTGERVHVLGHATADPERTIHLRPRGLVGRRGRFTRA